MNKIFLSVAFFAFVCVPSLASAGPILRTGDTISVDADQSLNGDFYALGSTVSVSGQSEDDVYIAGGNVTINAPVAKDLTVLGGTVQVHGDVGDDIRIVGGEVTIAKPVKGDVVVLGGTLTILSTASVEGDVLFLGDTVTIEGEVVGSVFGTANIVRLNSEVGGDVTLQVNNQFSIGNKAKLQGDVTYESLHEVARAQEAVITGEIRKTDVRVSTSDLPFVQVIVIEIMILLFSVFTLFLLSQKFVTSATRSSFGRIGMSGLMGIGILVTLPFIAILLCASVIGMLVGMLLLIAYVFLLILAVMLAPIFVGYLIQKVALHRDELTAYTVGGGVIAFIVIGIVPYIGGLLVFSCVMITLGSLGMMLYRTIRS